MKEMAYVILIFQSLNLVKNEWKEKITEMVPSYGKKLAENPELAEEIRNYTKEKLELEY